MTMIKGLALGVTAILTATAGLGCAADTSSSEPEAQDEDQSALTASRPTMRLRVKYIDEATGAYTVKTAEKPMCTGAEMESGRVDCVASIPGAVNCKPGTTYEARFVLLPGASPITTCPADIGRDPTNPSLCRVIETHPCGSPPLVMRGMLCEGKGALKYCMSGGRTGTADGQSWFGRLDQWIY